MKKKGRKTMPSINLRSRASFFNKGNSLIFIAIFAIVGGLILYITNAASTTVTYTGSFNKKKPSASYSVTPGATGTLNASLTYSKLSSATVSLVNASGLTIATKTGASPISITAPVSIATYKVALSGIGNGNYTLNLSYPIADNTPPPDTTPPSVSITAPTNGSSLSGTVSVTGSASDNVALSKVEVSLDNGAYQPAVGTTSWSYSLNTSTLTNASHTITARATDSSNNVNTGSVTVTVSNAVADTTPPSVPSNLSSSAQTLNSVNLVWTPSTDNVGVTNYDIYRGGTKIASTTVNSPASVGNTYLDSGLASGTTYSYYVMARDAAGNVSAKSNICAVSTLSPDTTKPSITITAPASGSTLSGTAAIAGTASDNVALSSVKLQIDNGPIITPSGTGSWSYSWDTTLFSNGAHSIVATATDNSGNIGTTTTNLNVNNQATGDTTKPSVLYPNNSSQITNPLSGTQPKILIFATDNLAVTRLEFQVGSYQPAPIAITPGPNVEDYYPLDTTKYPDGTYLLYINAYDAAGNLAQAIVQITIRNTSYTETKTFSDGLYVSINTVYNNPANGLPWTADQIHTLIASCALGGGDFGAIAPHTKVYVQDIYASAESSSASSTGTPPVFTNYSGAIYLNASAGYNGLYDNGDNVACHEYGHDWTIYHLYITQNNDWSPYLNERWVTADGSVTLATDSRTDSTYNWSPFEIIADDYRMLIAVAGVPDASSNSHLNYSIVDPRNQPGLKDWFLNVWK